jgi:hypothetical protein
MADATKDDAQLLVQLAQLGTQMVDSKARGWIWSDAFISDPGEFFEKHPPGSVEFDYVGGTAGWYETVATLWKRELIDEELVFDWLWVKGMWDRLGPILLAMREHTGVAALWSNFERMAEAQAEAVSPP